jgi:3-oxoacyl-[acyl-carrier protein] reductase
MDLGIKGRTAIVCASSKGLGKGCAVALAEEGVDLVLNARGKDALEATAAEIRAKTGVKVTTVAADVSTPAGRLALLAACPSPDILVNNAGGPPLGDFRDWDRDDWLKALDANMLAPIELIKAVIDKMIARRFGRIVNITSSAVKAPIPILGLSNGARSGLTGFVAGLARQVAPHQVTINNLLPGSFDTDRLTTSAAGAAGRSGQTPAAVLEDWRKGEATGRFGTAAEFGAACAFLCSTRAGYINGQNLLLDGGTFPGTF